MNEVKRVLAKLEEESREEELEIVKIKEGRPMTSSLVIATLFNKQHYNVMAKIKENEVNFNALNFKVVDYIDEKGESRPMYLLDRDFTTFIIMGFTGKKAVEWKLKYIEAFNKMESEILKQTNMVLPQNYIEALKQLTLQAEINQKMLLENKKLLSDVKIFSEKELTWTNRKELGQAVRNLSSRVKKVEGKIWNELYKEIYNKHSIFLRGRGKSPYIQHIKDDEWEFVTLSFAAICVRYGESPSEIFGRG